MQISLKTVYMRGLVLGIFYGETSRVFKSPYIYHLDDNFTQVLARHSQLFVC